MKRAITILMLAVPVFGFMTACGGNNGKSRLSPESNEEAGSNENAVADVRNFGKNFAEKASAGEFESFAATYPAITEAESIVPIKGENIIVAETSPGVYQIKFSEGVTLNVTRSQDGTIKIIDSHGLFVFPADKVEIAKKTGMWDDNLSDEQLSERMKDEKFFKYIHDQTKKKTSNIIKIGKFIETPAEVWDPSNDGIGYQILTNQTNTPISGSEYTIIKERYSGGAGGDPSEWIESSKGQDLDANSTIRIKSWQGMHFGSIITSIKWNLTPQELQEKFASFNGKEYQKYLDSKK